ERPWACFPCIRRDRQLASRPGAHLWRPGRQDPGENGRIARHLGRHEKGCRGEPREATAGGASIEVLAGRLRVQAGGEPWDVPVGELIVLADNLRERITALEETAFLLTVAWPPGAGAWEQEMTGRHT